MAVRHEQHRADYEKDQLQTHVELGFSVADRPSNDVDSDYGSESIGLPEDEIQWATLGKATQPRPRPPSKGVSLQCERPLSRSYGYELYLEILPK